MKASRDSRWRKDRAHGHNPSRAHSRDHAGCVGRVLGASLIWSRANRWLSCTDQAITGTRELLVIPVSSSTTIRPLLQFTMPPRKKAKRAHSTTPQDDAAVQSTVNTPGSSDSAGKPEPEHDFLTDPWTDEQETALLKAIIKWKPVGELMMLLTH